MTGRTPGSQVGTRRSAVALGLDPIACRGVAVCHLVAERIIDLDPWGFPIVRPLDGREDERAARAAVAACPHRALFIKAISRTAAR